MTGRPWYAAPGSATATAPRRLAFRYHPKRPHEITAQREWAVEVILDRAHDCDDTELADVLCALNPQHDETIAAGVERLYDVADEVAAAESANSYFYWKSVDHYVAQLRVVASLIALRGAA